MYISPRGADGPTAGCFSGLLRRFACGAHRDAYPRAVGSPPSPGGVVARLMGLEPMPTVTGPSDASTGSIRRTRSVNSGDGWNGFLAGHANWAAKGSRSFREPPTFLREDDADFFVLSFVANDVGSRKEIRQCDEGKITEKVATAKRTSRKAADSECSSQDSSPVSVLDRHADTDAEYVMGLGLPVSEGKGEANKKGKKEKARRKQLPPKVKVNSNSKCASSPPTPPKIKAAEVIYSSKETRNPRSAAPSSSSSTAVENKKRQTKCSERRGEETAPLTLSCQLADDDVSRSSWRGPWELNGDVGTALEIEIMDFLVQETVAELSFE